MKWILIVFSLLAQVDGYTSSSVEFETEKNCKEALKHVKSVDLKVKAFCVPK